MGVGDLVTGTSWCAALWAYMSWWRLRDSDIMPGRLAWTVWWRACPQAEMSEDEGHSDSGSDVEADADGVLVRWRAPGPDLPGASLTLMLLHTKRDAHEAGRRSSPWLRQLHIVLRLG